MATSARRGDTTTLPHIHAGLLGESPPGRPITPDIMTLLIYLLALIGAITFVFFSVDCGIGLYTWQSRIHIGRWTDRKVWQQAVEKKARQWLHQSPTVRKTEQDRLVLWDMLRGNYRSSTIQSWQDAGLLLALSEQDAQAYAKHHSSLFAKETWQVDQSLLAYALKKKNAQIGRAHV